MVKLSKKSMALAIGFTALLGCEESKQQVSNTLEGNTGPEVGAMGHAKFASIPAAEAKIAPTGEKDVYGTVYFSPGEGEKDMQIEISLKGLNPGLHGFHIHQRPDCGDAGNAAGPHFSPSKSVHAAPEADEHHAGDLGNIRADEYGKVEARLISKSLAFSGINNVLNRAVVVHAGRDDLRSQPSGDAGERIACGVIRPTQDVLVRASQK
ncbi:superoxide dismutase (Cu-Zn) [gamma proteobacterium BDW918]|uniref:Superoxide dismutase [Cu-Zn] n=1 Tax=Zhongshania aliphaticivorans TaxID=1470434 RepID=A0A127M539_9GAMM|nr:superoxide dismutase family protein [Zhongshania aliphaticivorans]AMO68358.1 hypothetical protein AZF00_08580 [Zhongshania aliphaticivorans]EIF44254.1 superoxide dismutase (Cu-Zn) [gamma proteobacterium BDW918]|tara:strand:+ start:275 stop:901 length:627 start_codon:yes stop_codon:yes gene_type:complete